MPLRSLHRMRGWGERRAYAHGLAVFLFASLASSIALLANWGGTPDPIVLWLCGLSSISLLVACVARWRR